MINELCDPDKPVGFVVEVDGETGVATRNDGKLLQPVTKNPWYVLMTIGGEQEGYRIDEDLQRTNRRYWNGWACAEISDERRASLAKRFHLAPESLAPLDSDEWEIVRDAFRVRLGEQVAIPEPSKGVLIENAFFDKAIALAGCYIPGPVSFQSSTFSRDALFRSAEFGWNTWFQNSTFERASDFTDARFHGEAWFQSVTFSQDAEFSGATFEGQTLFSSAKIEGRALWYSASFMGAADFTSTKVSRDSRFDGAKFQWGANFSSTTFNEKANFEFTKFGAKTSFCSAKFVGVAYFYSATFGGSALFDTASFQTGVRFKAATFGGDVQFSNSKFGDRTIFTKAQFAGGVPAFYQCSFHQDTEFTPEYDHWPEINEENSRESKRAYTRLRQVMSELHIPDDEHFFFRQEMRCKALLEGRFYHTVSRAFEVASDYGHSVGRPVSALVGSIALFWPVFGSFLKNVSGVDSGSAIGQGLALSFANTFSFFGFHRRFFDAEDLEQMPGWLQVIAGGQTVLGFLLLFFLGLGLRNRFRLK